MVEYKKAKLATFGEDGDVFTATSDDLGGGTWVAIFDDNSPSGTGVVPLRRTQDGARAYALVTWDGESLVLISAFTTKERARTALASFIAVGDALEALSDEDREKLIEVTNRAKTLDEAREQIGPKEAMRAKLRDAQLRAALEAMPVDPKRLH